MILLFCYDGRIQIPKFVTTIKGLPVVLLLHSDGRPVGRFVLSSCYKKLKYKDVDYRENKNQVIYLDGLHRRSQLKYFFALALSTDQPVIIRSLL